MRAKNLLVILLVAWIVSPLIIRKIEIYKHMGDFEGFSSCSCQKKKKSHDQLGLSIQDFGEDNVRCYQIKNSIYGALRVGCLICDERRIEGRSSELWYWKEGYFYHVIYAGLFFSLKSIFKIEFFSIFLFKLIYIFILF